MNLLKNFESKVIQKSLFLLIGLLVVVFVVINIVVESGRNNRINPNIYPSFRLWENYSLKYVLLDTTSIDEYNRCKKHVDYFLEYKEQWESPDATEYYAKLERMGFSLPPLYLNEPASEELKRECFLNQDNLLSEQVELIKKVKQKFSK